MFKQHTPSARPFCLRSLALLTALAALLTLAPAGLARAESTGTLSAKVVLRKSADADSKALQTLPEGDEVDVLDTSGSWYKVSYGKYTGYVMKKYVAVSRKSVAANADKIEALGDAPGALCNGRYGGCAGAGDERHRNRFPRRLRRHRR